MADDQFNHDYPINVDANWSDPNPPWPSGDRDASGTSSLSNMLHAQEPGVDQLEGYKEVKVCAAVRDEGKDTPDAAYTVQKGYIYWREDDDPDNLLCPTGEKSPFNLREAVSDGGEPPTYTLRFEPGYVYEIDTLGAGEGISRYEVEVQDDMGAWVALSNLPEVPWSGMGETWYVHIQTDPTGALKEIASGRYAELVDSKGTEATHIPDDNTGMSGTDGNYYIPVCTIIEDSGMPRQQSPDLEGHDQHIFWQQNHSALTNVGGGAKVYNKYDKSSNTHQLNTIVGGFAIVESGGGADDVNLDFEAENMDSAGTPALEIFHQPQTDVTQEKALFRKIGHRETQEQITVEEVGGSTWSTGGVKTSSPMWLRVRGNGIGYSGGVSQSFNVTGIYGGASNYNVTTLTVKDGLVSADPTNVELKSVRLKVCQGTSGSKTIREFDFVVLDEIV